MSDIEFEKAVRTALIMDIDKTYGFNDDISDSSIPHTLKYLRFEKRILKDPMGYANRVSQSLSKRVMKTAAMIVLTIAVMLGLMMAIPPVRAFVFSVVEEFVDHNEHKTYEARPDGELGKCTIGYLPDGFETVSGSNAGRIICSDGHCDIILIYDYAYSESWLFVNNEDVVVQNTMVGEHSAVMYISSEVDRNNGIVWYDEVKKIQFCISSTIDIDELIKVAESVYIE